jgi:hypothetical protein
MLYKCANESCNTPFRRLREGKLFKVETEYFAGRGPSTLAGRKAIPTRRSEHYWLCDACSPFVTLTFDQGTGRDHRAPAGRSRQEHGENVELGPC